MQSLASFFEDNRPLAIAASVAAIVVLIIVVSLLYRLLFGRRLRASTNGRARQPRLGIVDAYDLDRQRQLVLVRRDNVEHLLMIGGPTDVVVEASIVRTQSAQMARDKDGMGQQAGTPALIGGAAAAALPPAAASPSPRPATPRPEPQGAGRADPPMTSRTEPPVSAPPVADRVPVDRPPPRPIAVLDPGAPAGSAPSPDRPPGTEDQQARPAARPPVPRPSPVPPPAPAGDDVRAPRPPLPPRPVTPRPPLPPRPSLAASLPPRPPRPLPGRTEPSPRPDATVDAAPAAMAPPPVRGPGGEPAPRFVRDPAPEAPVAEAPPKNIESLESLEEEMAKLLGRPAPRRDG